MESNLIVCPYCDADNFEGADVCEHCQHSLVDLDLQRPATEVEHSLLKDRVRVLLSKPPIAVAPATPVRQVLDTLIKNKIGCVFVVEDGKIVGVFSERDALFRLGSDASQLGDQPISEWMTRNARGLGEDAKIAYAVRSMDQGGFRHVPIIDNDGKLEGVISVRDILRYLTDKMTPSPS